MLGKAVYNAVVDYDLPSVDLLTLLFDSTEIPSTDDTILHAEAGRLDNSLTKAQTASYTRRVAHILRQNYGIGASGPGIDVVVCISSGQALLPTVFYGTIAAGGVYSAASSSLTSSELRRQIENGDAVTLITSPDCLAVAEKAAEQAGLPRDRIIVLDSFNGNRKLLSWTGEDLLSLQSAEHPWERITDPAVLGDRVICLVYSSGTTGAPKGVMITQANMVTYALVICYHHRAFLGRQRAREPSFSFEYRTLAHVPAAHIAGLQGYFVHPAVHGGCVYWMPKFDFVKFIEYNRSLRITTFFSVPPIYLMIAQSPLVKDHFRTLYHVLSGAAPMGPELTREVEKKLECTVSQVWGMSETTGSITIQPWDEKDDTGSISAIQPNMKLRIVDEDELDVEDGQPGEFVVQSAVVTPGYWKNPQATAESFTKCGEWFKTGDVGLRRNGKLYIVDRKKELIKYKGLQVAPAELEALLLSHPLIMDAAVIGVPVPGEEGNEVPRAYIVADPVKLPESEVKAFVGRELASYKQLRGGVVYIKAIPKSPTGKILRRELRELAKREETRQARL
ncbi:4-coumarate-CoA ligase [Plectosphaerella plurivora]|uniref:4-coumarate-CoA ligase n=1 Tax=Plectosphaerella plurivora TaxID=936078 RepID=A0A9P8VJW5_9PEZI|nr:4-coumarate-CoA ligase [Plectosphaerella plurivora]